MRYFSLAVLVLVPLVNLTAAEETELRVNGDRLNQRFVDLAQYGKNSVGGMDRFAFSDADVESRPFLKGSPHFRTAVEPKKDTGAGFPILRTKPPKNMTEPGRCFLRKGMNSDECVVPCERSDRGSNNSGADVRAGK